MLRLTGSPCRRLRLAACAPPACAGSATVHATASAGTELERIGLQQASSAIDSAPFFVCLVAAGDVAHVARIADDQARKVLKHRGDRAPAARAELTDGVWIQHRAFMLADRDRRMDRLARRTIPRLPEKPKIPLANQPRAGFDWTA
jgi:hypothetical protein